MDMNDIVINGNATLLHCQNGIAHGVLNVPCSAMLYGFAVPLDNINTVNTMQDKTLATESHIIHFMNYLHNVIREGFLLKEAVIKHG